MLAVLQQILLYTLPFLFVLTVVVTVHELGHFLVARWCGVAVDQFSIGFGRAILHWSDKSGVQWRVGWLPLGGYVKFAGDANAASAAPTEDDLAAFRRDIIAREGVGAELKYFHFKPLWQRTLVVLAGPGRQLPAVDCPVRPFARRIRRSWPHAANRFGRAGLAGGARAGFQTGDLVTAADGRRINDFGDISTYTMLRADQPIRFTVRRGAASFDLLATPERKVVANPVTGASKLGFLGVGSSLAPADTFRRRYNPLQALGGGVSRSWEQIETTVFYISRIFRGQESGDQLRSFLGIAKVSGQFAQAGAEGRAERRRQGAGRHARLDQPDRRAVGEHRFRQPFAFAGAGRWTPCVLRLRGGGAPAFGGEGFRPRAIAWVLLCCWVSCCSPPGTISSSSVCLNTSAG